MKSKAFAVVLVSFVLHAGAQKIRLHRFSEPAAPASSYTLSLHVLRSEFRQPVTPAATSLVAPYVHLEGKLADRYVGLDGDLPGLLPPGDYPIRLIGREAHRDGSLAEQYDLLLPDGSHRYLMLSAVGPQEAR